ncbi:MAG: hypothetical protein FWD34_02930 [Oscillospiraceae bacterium]|nr:hypothetical protein [Oscillospiraceae bacterium]
MVKTNKNSLKVFLFIGIFLLSACSGSNPLPLNSDRWGTYDVGYHPERYNMTLWLFETNWFESKTDEEILELLPDPKVNEIIDEEIHFHVKFRNPNFIFGIDPYELTGILTIYFNDGLVIRAEYWERKDVNSEYVLKLEWGEL